MTNEHREIIMTEEHTYWAVQFESGHFLTVNDSRGPMLFVHEPTGLTSGSRAVEVEITKVTTPAKGE